MAVSIVNGFFCASSCDVSKAKKGQNPHPSTDPSNLEQTSGHSNPSRADQPAVLFGGALRGATGADSVKPVDGTQQTDPANLGRSQFMVDLLA